MVKALVEVAQEKLTSDEALNKLRWAVAMLIPLVSIFWFISSHINRTESKLDLHAKQIESIQQVNANLMELNTDLRLRLSNLEQNVENYSARIREMEAQSRDLGVIITDTNRKLDRLLGRLEGQWGE